MNPGTANRSWLGPLATALALLGAGCASAPPLARVNGEPITADELSTAFGRKHSGHLAFLLGETEVRAALSREIDNELLVQEAERLGLGERPEIVAAVEDLRTRRAVRHLIEVEVEGPAAPSEAAIRAAWEEYTDELVVVRQIVVPRREEAEEIATRLAAGEPFDRIARERSRVGSQRADGLLPPIGWGMMEPGWDRVAFALEPGEISAPFASGGAWEILQMVERQPVDRPDLAEARSRLEGILLRRGLEERRRRFSERLFADYEVRIELDGEALARHLAAGGGDGEAAVARWRDGRLTAGELVERVDPQSLAALNPERAAFLLDGHLRDLITERLLPLEARRRGFTELPEIEREAATLRREQMLAILHQEFIYRDLEITEEEARAWYDAHPEKTTAPERRRVAHLVVADRERAEAVVERLAGGEVFETLVDELSLDTETAARGGELGWVTAEETPPGWESVLELGELEISPPLPSRFGWHLVRVLEIEPPRRRDFEEVRQQAFAEVLQRRHRKLRSAWVRQLRDAARVEVSDRAVRAFVRDQETTI